MMDENTRSMHRRQFLACAAAATATLAISSQGCLKDPPTRAGAIWKPGGNDRFALTNVTVIDVSEGVALPDRIVTVKNGRIEGIYTEAPYPIKGAPSFDCKGSFLIPGLINAHCHLTMFSTSNVGIFDAGAVRAQMLRNYEDSIAWGITTARDMGSAPKILLKDREKIEQGKLIGPRIISSLGFITVAGGYPEFLDRLPKIVAPVIGHPALLVTNVSDAKDHVKRYQDLGASFVKIAFDHRSLMYGREKLNTLTDKQVEAIKNEAAKNSMKVAAHHLYSLGLERGLKFGIDTMEHIIIDADLTEKQIQRIVDIKVPITPTLTSRTNLAYNSSGDPYSGQPALQRALKWKEETLFPEIALHSVPIIQKRCRELIEYYQTESYKLPENAGKPSFNPQVFTRGVVVGQQNLQKLIQAGAVIGVGNDAGVPFTFPGMFQHEMYLLTQNGMTNAQVLKAATKVNAKICGLDSVCGSIDPGKSADLVLLAANPLEEIGNVGKVQAVFKQGELLSKKDDFPKEPTAAL